ncbi:MAG: biosynthetic peptidoglycan transglycosylase, partial [Acidobacteriota bacterium]
MKKKKLLWILVLLPAALALSVSWPFPKHKLNPSPVISLRLLARDGRLLREVLSDDGGRCRWVKLGEVSPVLVRATLAAEDQSFYFHCGVNILSLSRALWQNLRQGEIVSGASTITQQLIRNLWPGRRTVWAKLREAWLALRLEKTVSKEEILVQYLNRICYGNQAYGVEAASRLYFDKPPSQLSPAEGAFLAAIPRSPSRLNPYRAAVAVRRRQMHILRRMHRLGYLDRPALERSLAERIGLVPENEKFRAPHFCDFILSKFS